MRKKKEEVAQKVEFSDAECLVSWNGELYTYMKIPHLSYWRASETVSGAKLVPCEESVSDLAKIKISWEVFEVLRKKKRKGETIREATERIILAAPTPWK